MTDEVIGFTIIFAVIGILFVTGYFAGLAQGRKERK